MEEIHPSRGAIGFGVFEVDLRAGELRKQGVKVKLQEQPFQILQILLEHPGEVVTREELQQRIWPADTFVDFDHGLYNAIKRLREALGDTAESPRYIETLPKRGYRFIGSLNGDLQAARQISQVPRKSVTSRHKTYYAGLVAIAVLMAAGLLYWLNSRPAHEAVRAVPQIRSIAVLPFTSLSDDVRQGYFAMGVTDSLTTSLARIKALRVVSRTTVENADLKKPSPEIARDLHVDALVEGTVQRMGDRVRITVQLIHGPTDQHLLAETFDADVKDELALENSIATAIANKVEVELTPEEHAQLKKVRPVDPKALDAYLEAQYHLDQARKLEIHYGKEPVVRAELGKMIGYLDRAVQQDPNYMPAYLAYFEALDTPVIPRLSLLPGAKAALQKVLELDETNVRAHALLARLLMQYEYDWAGAEREYRRAIQINPNSADAHAAYAEYLGNVERKNESKKELELAQALDPAHDYSFSCCGGAINFRPEMTLEQKRQILAEKAPDDPYLTAVLAKEYAIADRYKESVELWERCLTLYGWHDFVGVLKRANAKGGPKFALEEWMRVAEEYSRNHDDFPVVAMAFTYASLGNNDRAFAWLDKAYEQRSWCIIYLKDDSVWDPLRSDPRFKQLLRRVGLPP